jgi:hypothetical protein
MGYIVSKTVRLRGYKAVRLVQKFCRVSETRARSSLCKVNIVIGGIELGFGLTCDCHGEGNGSGFCMEQSEVRVSALN